MSNAQPNPPQPCPRPRGGRPPRPRAGAVRHARRPPPRGLRGVDREICILHAIDTLAPGAPGQWTKRGAPKVGAIEAVAGIDITAAERNRAWSKYAGWKEKRHALEELRARLANAQSERDRIAGDAAHLRGTVDGLAAELRRADRARRAAEASAASVARRAALAESKTESLLFGEPVCAAERAVVQADDSWRARSLRAKVDELLRCLAVGEGGAQSAAYPGFGPRRLAYNPAPMGARVDLTEDWTEVLAAAGLSAGDEVLLVPRRAALELWQGAAGISEPPADAAGDVLFPGTGRRAADRIVLTVEAATTLWARALQGTAILALPDA